MNSVWSEGCEWRRGKERRGRNKRGCLGIGVAGEIRGHLVFSMNMGDGIWGFLAERGSSSWRFGVFREGDEKEEMTTGRPVARRGRRKRVTIVM